MVKVGPAAPLVPRDATGRIPARGLHRRARCASASWRHRPVAPVSHRPALWKASTWPVRHRPRATREAVTPHRAKHGSDGCDARHARAGRQSARSVGGLLPSHQLICSSRTIPCMASALIETGSSPGAVRSRTGLAPRSEQGPDGSGRMSQGHTAAAARTPTTYGKPSAVMPSRNPVSSPSAASTNTTAGATPAWQADRICASAICGLVANSTSSGTPPTCHRTASLAHSRGKYSR